MRISECNYPVLKYLKWNKPLITHPDFIKKGDIDIFKLDKEEENDPEINAKMGPLMAPIFQLWPRLTESFTKNIDVVSNTFFQAAFQNKDKIFTELTMKDIFNKAGKNAISGTLIWGKIVFNYFYQGNITEDGMYYVIAHYDKRIVYAGAGGRGSEERFWVSKVNRNVTGVEPIEMFFKLAPIIIILFKRYADVEMVEAQKNKKVKMPDGEKILNESDLKINYFDCSWFKTIVRKEGFLVSGHFRLQPYKDEKKEWDYKLIYIEPYQKHGYVRTAKKVVEERKFINEK